MYIFRSKEDDTVSFTLEMVQLFIRDRKKWFIPEFGPGYMALYSLNMYWLDKNKPLNAVQRKAKDDIGRMFEGGLAKAIADKHD
jgi:hypothetical protein